MKRLIIHIIPVLILVLISGLIVSCNREISVKPSPKKPKEKVETVKTDDYDSIIKGLPSSNHGAKIVKDEDIEDAVNPITYQTTFAILLNEAGKVHFTKEDYSSLDKWNDLIQNRDSRIDSFQINKNIVVDMVIMLEERITEASEIGEKYIENIKSLEEDHMIFFLFPDESDGDKLDVHSSFVGMNIDKVDRHALAKMRALPGVLFEDGTFLIMRASGTSPFRYTGNRIKLPYK